MKLPDNSTLVTMTDFGTLGYGTLEPGTTREENISFTGITQNADGTATLTGVTRGLNFVSPYTSSAALKLAHAGGVTFIITNNAPFYDGLLNKNDDETIVGTYTFTDTAVPRMNTAHTYGAGEEEYFATKRYADSLALAGAPDASTTQKGMAEEATQAEVDAGTAAGSAARLFVNPSTVRAKLYHDVAVDSVGTDSYAITVSPAPSAYAQGQVFQFKAGTANTGAATLNVNSLGAITIKKANGADLETNDIRANQIVQVVYNSTGPVFNMQSLLGNEFLTEADAQVAIQGGSYQYAADAGASDTYAITLSPAPTAYTTGMVVHFYANTANTGAATLNVNSLGAKTIKKKKDQDLETGDVEAGQILTVVYDGTNFQMQSELASANLVFKNGRQSHDLSVNGADTIAHGLGKTPLFVRVSLVFAIVDGSGTSIGVYNGTTVSLTYGYANSATVINDGSTSDIIHVITNPTTGDRTSATISVDATNITITWTKSGSPTGTPTYMWEAYA